MGYRVFVSSTFEDLERHRAIVIQTLRTAGFDVDPMEDWTSAPGEPRVLSLDRVEECDLLVLLVARRRGYLPPGNDRSITQLEYDHAFENGIDVLAFLMDEGAAWPAHWDERATDPAVVAFRDQLATRHTIRLFDEAPESVQLAASLTRWVQDRSTRLVPQQLPRPPEDFTGREAEVATLAERLLQGGASVAGVRGLGGVGKTSLALAVGQLLKKRFRDGQIYLDLAGTTAPLTSSAAMLHVIRTLRREASVSDEEAEIQGLYHSLLSGNRVLLLMDNASDRQQVESLVPPEPSVMLVTSRRHFVLPGMISVDLSEMTMSEAEALLTTIVPRIGDQAKQIAKRCGGLPLALRLAGNALAMRPDLGAAEYAERLALERKRIPMLDRADESRGVYASLSLSHAMLGPEAQARVAMLSVFPADFDLAAVARVWDVEAPIAGDRLGELLGCSLLQWNEDAAGAGRYRMHDLVRLFESEQLCEPKQSVASERHARHFLDLIGDAADQYRSGREGVVRGLSSFDQEWENIRTGFAWCTANASESEAAASMCSLYAARGADILQLRQHRDDRIRWFEKGLEQAIRAGDRQLEAELLGHLGVAFGNVAELSRAIEFHQRSLTIMREIGDRTGEGVTLENLGEAHWRAGLQRESIGYYEQSLEIGRGTGDARRESNSLLNMALAHWQLGEPQSAIEMAERCLNLSREIGDRQKEAQSLGIMGLSYKDLGEPQRCVELCRPYLEIAREMGDRFSEGTAQIILGIAYRDLDDLPQAMTCFESALNFLREIGDRFFEGEACYEMGLALEKAGELARAKAAIEVRLAYRRETGHPGATEDADRVAEIEARLAAR